MTTLPIWSFSEKTYPPIEIMCRRKFKRLKRKKIFVKIPFELWHYPEWDEITICEDSDELSDYVKRFPNKKIYSLYNRNIRKKRICTKYFIDCGILYDGWDLREMRADTRWKFVSHAYFIFDTQSAATKFKLES